MKCTFLGGADEVGASCTLIEMGGRRILVDCGIRPSPRARYGLGGDQLPDLSLLDGAGAIDAILVTHAHTDHTGGLELVAGRFPDTPVYATPPTIALMRVLHQDARRIMKTRLEEEGELPLFDDVAVERLMAALVPIPFQTRLPLAEGLVATFYPAGHIAGAALIVLESDEGRVLVSGDLSFSPQRTVGGAKLPALEPDVLILESTYGGRLHANRAVQERRMVEAVQEVTEAGGKVLIPAFALGRAQEVLLILSEHQRQGKLPGVPIWADGMVRAVCQVYSSFSDDLPLALQERNGDFLGELSHFVQNHEQRNALIWQPGPAVIVASSGMLAGGPSTAYARALAGLPQHAILLTGYQDEEAPGRRLQEMVERGRGTLRLGKDRVDVQCRLGTYSLSAHADEGQLISLVETLNPAHTVLVHGDEDARASLAGALQERKRLTYQPQAGQVLEFHFKATRSGRKASAAGGAEDAAVDVRRLWEAVTQAAGGYFYLQELAQAWWGDAYRPDQLERLADALAGDDLYFAPDARRPDLYRARAPEQVEVTLQRRARMLELAHLPGQWVSLRATGDAVRLARCTAVARECFWVENDEGEPERAWPEDLLAILGVDKPDEAALERQSGLWCRAVMEPNQALALANASFPPEARLRKVGYRLSERVLLLTFDLPDAARRRYADALAALAEQSGWQVELTPEVNQGALFALVREVLPPGYRVIKGPALHRSARRVAVTVSGDAGEDGGALEQARRQFLAESGFELDVTFSHGVAPALPPQVGAAAGQMEINEAYALIKAALAGSTLYRVGLKGGEIVLSFISERVGERYRKEIDALSLRVGWPLSINPQPNQGAIGQAAQALLAREGITSLKGPSLHTERSEVVFTVAALPAEDRLRDMLQTFEEETGFRLVLETGAAMGAPVGDARGEEIVQIPVARIRLQRYQCGLVLNESKLAKAVERARRLGRISPPIRVRRTEDAYVLLDGLYRLRAAEALGAERIPAVVE